MVVCAILAVIATTLAHHLGFFDALLGILTKVLKCYKCCTFWVVLCVIMYIYKGIIAGLITALCAAYLSHWVMLLWGELNLLYNKVWQNQEKRRNSRKKRR